jgi:hypothetical protein
MQTAYAAPPDLGTPIYCIETVPLGKLTPKDAPMTSEEVNGEKFDDDSGEMTSQLFDEYFTSVALNPMVTFRVDCGIGRA